MDMVTKRFYIGGMSCAHCQERIESRLRATAGVRAVAVSYVSGRAQVTYDADAVPFQKLQRLIEKLDYTVLREEDAGRRNLRRTLALLGIILLLYAVLQRSGLLNLLVPGQLAQGGMGYGMLFITGLLTSVHCVAMCGGITVSQCLPGGRSGTAAPRGLYAPAALYNAGRVAGYTAVGAALGGIGYLIGGGAAVGVPVVAQGLLKVAAGVLMVVAGANLLGLFPWLRHISLRLPGVVERGIAGARRRTTLPFAVGLLNALMPCGPLQSMQIIALASGSPLRGALSMLAFSLGTVPLMLGLGSLVSILGRRFARAVMTAGSVVVVVLGLAMLSQGVLLARQWRGGAMAERGTGAAQSIANAGGSPEQDADAGQQPGGAVSPAGEGIRGQLRGSGGGRQQAPAGQGASVAQISPDGSVQEVRSVLTRTRYPVITVKKGIPVRWTIDAPPGSLTGCNYRMIIGDYGIGYQFGEGENVIEFMPDTAGTVPYSCWMGMVYGRIIVEE